MEGTNPVTEDAVAPGQEKDAEGRSRGLSALFKDNSLGGMSEALKNAIKNKTQGYLSSACCQASPRSGKLCKILPGTCDNQHDGMVRQEVSPRVTT